MKKKIFTTVLTFLLVFGLSIPVLSAEVTPQQTETINETESVFIEGEEKGVFEYPVETLSADRVEDFVKRLYRNILQRDADGGGLEAWVSVLKSGKEQGAKVAQGFIESDEFKSRVISNADYIRLLYNTFFDREADPTGLEGWLGVLDSGLSRMHVFKGFAESPEFTGLCDEYGITRGNVTLTAPMDQNENITKFVIRCYRLCLGRDADPDGLNAWCSQILNGKNTAKEAAYGFVFSGEFISRNLSNSDYVKILYKVFMDRESDPSGLSAWIDVLAGGKSRTHVFNGFADSLEFRGLCNSYGINSGSGIYVGHGDYAPTDYKKYYDGTYKVGKDIPAGEYILFSTKNSAPGYFAAKTSSSDSLDNIITNGLFGYNSMVTVKSGEYLELQRCYAVSIDDNPAVNTKGEGTFKIGVHLAAGEYKIASDTDTYAYVAVLADTQGGLGSIITNDNFLGNKYVTVEDGQYLVITRGHIVR